MKLYAYLFLYILFGGLSACGARSPSADSIEFDFKTEVHCALPPGQSEGHLWVPLPPPGPHQSISDLRVESDGHVWNIDHEKRHGNRLLHVKLTPQQPEISLEVTVRVKRQEISAANPDRDQDRLVTYLQSNSMVPVGREATTGLSQKVKALSQERGHDKVQAREVYEVVIDHMRYDKSGEGWGQGDVAYACAAGAGNCTDYHSLFIALAREFHIPARFEIGYMFDPSNPKVKGYHCWAQYYHQDQGWLPVDISEIDKAPERESELFATLPADRVTMTVGRDLNLGPAHQGSPLNFMARPYFEVDRQDFSDRATVSWDVDIH